jgi:hypothetical protein
MKKMTKVTFRPLALLGSILMSDRKDLIWEIDKLSEGLKPVWWFDS